MFGYHLNLQLHGTSPFLHRGYLGVDGFFLLSGLLLAHAHPRLGLHGRELRAFWSLRLIRIYPVHLATILLLGSLLVLGALTGHPPRDPGRFGARELWLNLLLIHGWGASDRWAWNYPSWSISTEWLGYLLFPFLWRCVRGASSLVVAVVAVAMLGALAWVARAPGVGLNLTYAGAIGRMVPEFVVGMAACRLAPAIARRVPGPWLAAAGLAWIAAALTTASDALVVPGLLLCLAGLLCGAMQGRAPVVSRLPGMEAAGRLSYAFYMSFAVVETTQAFVWRALDAAPPDHPLAYVAANTLGTLALAIAVRALVERPALRLGRLFIVRARA